MCEVFLNNSLLNILYTVLYETHRVYCLLRHLEFTFHSAGATVGWVLGRWQCCLGTFYSLLVVQPAWLKNESDTYKERVICKSKTQCLDFLRILMFFYSISTRTKRRCLTYHRKAGRRKALHLHLSKPISQLSELRQ